MAASVLPNNPTVADLVAALQALPQDKPVVLAGAMGTINAPTMVGLSVNRVMIASPIDVLAITLYDD